MYAIQENELEQLRDLGAFLDLELNYFAQSLALLQEVKDGWTDEWVARTDLIMITDTDLAM
jgi:hypothetical protein